MTEPLDEDAYWYIGSVHAERADGLPVEVAETWPFQNKADGMLSFEERARLHVFLALNPECGLVIPGTGGVRKMRWPGLGKGKRGGYRIVYYFHDNQIPIYLLAIFAKGQKIDLTEEEKKDVRQFVRELVGEYRGRNQLRLIS